MKSACLSVIVVSLFLILNTSYADVRINEHNAILPDPLVAIIPAPEKIGPIFLMPVDGRLSSLFGERVDPFSGEIKDHRGIDLANLKSTKVCASASGRVSFTGCSGGCGIMVEIVHEKGFKTRYCHLNSTLVSKGEKVTAGEAIGKMGSTGRATGSHLHFELLKDGRPVDPAGYLMF